ncbi:PIG-L deacetylase family protein [Cerasicoccus frondis]|uniref:PIG-L deacetylase family protein n=1 Tax=Cerasicoccus frondis TaxID=490090 RepID=UPI002852A3DC|nr:PIG-L family deacetylase [Cerasicoccus frondis]
MHRSNTKPIVLAAAAHPDDIEFCFAGTLLLLKEAGCEIHMWTLANGCCGDMTHPREEVAKMRWQESQDSAKVAGAIPHEPLFDDLSVFYDRESIAKVSAVIREIRPTIILTHSPQDYMEDHQNVCRLVVTGAFSRGMPNHITSPQRPVYDEPVRVYHAAPHGLHDGLDEPFKPDFLVDIESVLMTKRKMLECHKSQQGWLQETQEMDAYIEDMVSMARAMADRDTCNAIYAEGWRRHSHLGFCVPAYNPLPLLLAKHLYPSKTTTIDAVSI